MALQPPTPVMFGGQNIASPNPQQYPTMKAGNIQSYINAFQTGQNQSNQANNQRYNQGLGVLNSGGQSAQGYLGQALANTQSLGEGERQQLAQQYQNQSGQVAQSAVSRGLGNTTVTDALQSGVNRTRDLGNINLNESLARQSAAVQQQQAAQANQTSGSIANFIQGRNDVGPDAGLLSNLVTGAASNPGNAVRTGTVTHQPAPSIPDVSSGLSSSGGGGGALGSGGYMGAGSFGQAGYFGAGGGGGGGGSPGAAGSIGGYLGSGGQGFGGYAGGSAGVPGVQPQMSSVNPTGGGGTVETTPQGSYATNGIPSDQAGSISVGTSGMAPSKTMQAMMELQNMRRQSPLVPDDNIRAIERKYGLPSGTIG